MGVPVAAGKMGVPAAAGKMGVPVAVNLKFAPKIVENCLFHLFIKGGSTRALTIAPSTLI